MIENALEIKGTHPKEVITTLVNVVTVDSGALLVDFNHLFADSCENLDCFMKFYKDTKVFLHKFLKCAEDDDDKDVYLQLSDVSALFVVVDCKWSQFFWPIIDKCCLSFKL